MKIAALSIIAVCLAAPALANIPAESRAGTVAHYAPAILVPTFPVNRLWVHDSGYAVTITVPVHAGEHRDETVRRAHREADRWRARNPRKPQTVGEMFYITRDAAGHRVGLLSLFYASPP